MRTAHINCAILVMLLGAAGSAADPPGGANPGAQGICGSLIGLTPGLYGLCVAFSEAQACDPDWTLDDPFEGCPPSSLRLLELYNKKKAPGDPNMPGVSEPCPCFTNETLMSVFPEVDRCRDFSAEIDPDRDQDGIELLRQDPLRVAQALRVNWATPVVTRCLFIDRSVEPNVFRNVEVSDVGLQLCDTEIRNYALSMALDCEAFR